MPSEQICPLPHEGVHVAVQKPSGPHRWPAAQVTYRHISTQSPARQNVPVGQLVVSHGSATHVPRKHTCGGVQPVA